MKRKKLAAWFWYAMLWCPCYAISQVWFRYRFIGKGHVPVNGPVLLVSNHQSHLDPVLVGLACPRQLKYLARQGLFFWPFSLWIRSLGAVPIDRERGAIGGIRVTLDLLKRGNAVLVFPEGSRTPDGKLHEFLSGFCLLARRGGAAIVPVAIEGAFGALPRGSAFARPHPITLAFGPAVTKEQAASLTDDELTAMVERRIRAMMGQSVVPDDQSTNRVEACSPCVQKA
ncbi:MAG TPA: lysophospholipid acyltransferase family protein [Lacipirellulaceae bacterium]|nr:lysophospholipid acyltransferase family protein [Lacipirellulaceae bacterium]